MVSSENLGISDLILIRPTRHQDHRGFFSETYNRVNFAELGIDDVFVQDNHSLSADAGVIRGLHFQIEPRPIAKLIRVIAGSIFDVAVDIRHGSPTFGEHETVVLTAEGGEQLYIPEGFAHGMCTLEPDTQVVYKVTDHWDAEVDKGIAWDDPALGIDWPDFEGRYTISDKDRSNPKLAESPQYFVWSES